ncbi:glycosyltransferase family 2 protein [Candidatus Uhrbacteria bacterium]|nr:glycosyltransferase family 2 protein [Candidatus Uhrbacteria bacterium]
MPREHFDIAVVMVSYNKILDLPSVQRAIDASPLRISFVLVDNASTELDAAVLAHTHMRRPLVIQRDGNYGMGASLNRGVEEVSADYYFFLNPDTSIGDLAVFDKLYAFMRAHPRTGIAAPRLRYLDGRLQETCRRFPAWFMPFAQRTNWLGAFSARYARRFLMCDYDHERPRMVDWVQGSALMISADLFRELGGFDRRFFMYFEDTDLCRQCWERCRPVYYVPHAEILHLYGKASDKEKGLLANFFFNPMARAHIASWMKYALKWAGKRI